MNSKYFIDHPVFASVISILIVIAGLVSMRSLPVSMYPEVTPPNVVVTASYPGANAATVAEAVAAPIELQLSGAKHLLYFQSTSTNDGRMNMTVTFEIGTDLDLAMVDVQNRVKEAEPRLPEITKRQGISVTKRSTNMTVLFTLASSDPRYDQLYLSNYATINILDRIKRVPGVGDAMVYGAGDYAMRVWLDPDRMARMGITTTEVAGAINEENSLYATGRIGARPGPSSQQLTVPVNTRGRLSDARQFEDIQVRTTTDGAVVRIRDIGRAELGAQSYDVNGHLNGNPTAAIAVYQQDGANALEVSRGVKAVMDECATSFPAGIAHNATIDTSEFVSSSIDEVVTTLIEAVLMVMLVVFLFLQNWRATLIPLLAVPVAVVGTFAGMLALGYTINTLTLFGLVLVIGIVVDDAIIVVENVERIMEETGQNVRDATVQAMAEVSGPIIAIVLVLSAVFVPVAFLGGLTGRFYQQFAITIALSVTISGIVALTLSPALCRLLLKAPSHRHARWDLLGRGFEAFNRVFTRITAGYVGTVGFVMRHVLMGMVVFAILGAATWQLFARIPTGFIPGEDMGYLIVAGILPEGASLERTVKVQERLDQMLTADPDIAQAVTLGGLNMLAGGTLDTNAITAFVKLKHWDERKNRPGSAAGAVAMRIMGNCASDPEAMVLAFAPPPVPGLGIRLGFDVQLQDTQGQGVDTLAATAQEFMTRLRQRPEIAAPNMTMSMGKPQFDIDVDREQARATGLHLPEVFSTLQALVGSLYVNDFSAFGRIYRVQLQAESAFRSDPASLGSMHVRSVSGELVPLSAVLKTDWSTGPNLVTRFNNLPAVAITGASAPGYSSGDAMRAVREVAATLPPGYTTVWSGASLQEVRASGQTLPVLLFGLVVVFLVLAALYESFSLPLAVMLAVPFGILGSLVACWLSGLDNNIYVQVGLLVLVGLAAKNAILIVEFAVSHWRAGMALGEAITLAARLRFRPILMTSLAFILGVVPLMLATGAGASGRIAIGTGVFGGMIAATILALILVPVFVVVVVRLFGSHGHTGSQP